MFNTQGAIGGVDSVQANGDVLREHIAETTVFTSNNYDTADAVGMEVDLVMRVVGTGSVIVAIDRFDKASKTWINALTGVAIVTNSTNRYRISPNIPAVANASAQDHLPEIFRVVVSHQNANPVTYSLSYHLSYG